MTFLPTGAAFGDRLQELATRGLNRHNGKESWKHALQDAGEERVTEFQRLASVLEGASEKGPRTSGTWLPSGAAKTHKEPGWLGKWHFIKREQDFSSSQSSTSS